MSFSYILYTNNNWLTLETVGQFFYILLLVVFVALLAFYSTRLLASARIGRKNGTSRNLEIIESIAIGMQAVAHVIRAGDKFYLIGVTKEKVTFLAELNESEIHIAEKGRLGIDTPFEKLIQRIISKRETQSGGEENDRQDN